MAYYGMMNGYGIMGGYGWALWIIWLPLVIFLFAAIFWLTYRWIMQPGQKTGQKGDKHEK